MPQGLQGFHGPMLLNGHDNGLWRFVYTGVRSFARSLGRSFVRLLVRSFVCSLVRSFARSFVFLSAHLPLEDGSDRRETLAKSVSDDLQLLIF